MLCITVSYGLVKGLAKQYPYHQPAMYEIYTTKRGVKKWRYIMHLGRARRSYSLATKDAMAYCSERGLPFRKDVRQYSTPLESDLKIQEA